jgi:hypothetical protein
MPTVQLEELDKLKKSNSFIETLTHNLPACSIAPQPPTLPHATDHSEKPYTPNKIHILLFSVLLKLRAQVRVRAHACTCVCVCVCVHILFSEHMLNELLQYYSFSHNFFGHGK